jgi:hypothetical protein
MMNNDKRLFDFTINDIFINNIEEEAEIVQSSICHDILNNYCDCH